MELYFLLFLSVMPPILFMFLIYWMDRHNPESIKNVLIALVLGIISTIPTLIVELIFENAPIFKISGLLGDFFESFFLVAPAEEFFKFIVIFLFLRRKVIFDEINDGIVYYGTGAIGFALLENIFYVFENGMGTGFLRAFTAIPIHTFCGVIVGYHAGIARFGEKKRSKFIMLRGILIAILIHASYNTVASAENFLILFFIPLVLGVYFIGFKLLRKGRMLSISSINTKINAGIKEKEIKSKVLIDEFGRYYFHPKKQLWKAIIARIILVVCILAWILLFIGNADDLDTSTLDLVLGMFILTFIPISLGLILEISYRRRKNKKIYIS